MLHGNRRGWVIICLGAVDVALWDLYGKMMERPVWQLLGGNERTRHQVVEGRIDGGMNAILRIEMMDAFGVDSVFEGRHRAMMAHTPVSKAATMDSSVLTKAAKPSASPLREIVS